MLDIQYIRDNKDKIKIAAAHKNFKVDLDKLLSVDAELLPMQQEMEKLQENRNKLSKQIGKASPDEREKLKEQVLGFKGRLEELTNGVREKKEELHQLMLLVPQPAADDVPVGKDDADNAELRTWGEKPNFSFKPKSHIELGESLGLMDFKRGVKLSGSRSYVLTGKGAELEQAVLRYTYDYLVKRNYKPMSVPVLVNEACMEGTGYFPLGRDQAYYVELDKMALVGTSEVPLCSFHTDEMLKGDDLPLKYMAQSTCFRREAGTYGKDTKGLYRVHQFQKIEQVIIAPADKDISETLHTELLGNAEAIMQAFGIPYRVVYVCTGDLGQGQVRKHDIEAWMPSRKSYGETHSCSTFYDFQARRLNIRYKDKEGKRHVAYTLNNTAIATPRALIPIIENFQTEDGRIKIPECLRPYMGGEEYIS